MLCWKIGIVEYQNAHGASLIQLKGQQGSRLLKMPNLLFPIRESKTLLISLVCLYFFFEELHSRAFVYLFFIDRLIL